MTAPRKKSRPAAERRRKPFHPSSRWLAFLAIQAFEQRGAFLSKVLDSSFTEGHVPPRDRRLATELAAETIRRRLTLDQVLRSHVDRPRDAVEREVWILLQLGCCQLLCLPQIPAHAAVHETVALCELLHKPRAKGFVNGILRSIERETSSVESRASGATAEIDLTRLSSAVLPLLDLHGVEQHIHLVPLARDVFASPIENPLEYISQIASLPRWLIDRWWSQRPDLRELLELGLWFTTPGRMSLRVNLLQTTRDKVLEVLQAAEVPAGPGELPESIVLRGSVPVADLPGFREGWFSVQDESAMFAAELLSPQPGERILDLCAAPGGKTCHLAERMQGTGEILACDISPPRLETVRENAARLRLSNVAPRLIGAEGNNLPAGPFDAVLVDVPCSNTGVLGKRPEARWRISPASFDELISMQQRLLTQALDRVRPGGRVLYSTCSIDAQENAEVVRRVLAARPDVILKTEQTHRPGHPADGGYQALLVID